MGGFARLGGGGARGGGFLFSNQVFKFSAELLKIIVTFGGRPYPSTSEVTRTRPRQEEWPCPGSRGRHASRRQHGAQRSAARQSRQRHTAKLASTRQHTAHSIAGQR